MSSSKIPHWNVSNKSASIRKWAEQIHKESKRVILADKTHAHIVFLFNDEGLVRMTPPLAQTDHAQIHASILQDVQKNNLYGAIHIGEVKVSELNAQDKSEVLYLRMESRDGDCVVYIDKIMRRGDKVELGEGRTIQDEERNWF